jgi:hypothetical protein
MSNKLLADFLAARQIIDRDPTPAGNGKDKPNTMPRPAPECEDSVKMIIETKPSKKVVMDFLKKKVAQYTDISSSEED